MIIASYVHYTKTKKKFSNYSLVLFDETTFRKSKNVFKNHLTWKTCIFDCATVNCKKCNEII